MYMKSDSYDRWIDRSPSSIHKNIQQQRHSIAIVIQESEIPTMAVSVSRRLTRRKYLYNRLYLVSNIMCFVGLAGVILMMINSELTFASGHDADTIINWFIKLSISILTVFLIALIIYYHQLDLCLYSLKNSIEDWRIGITLNKIFLVLIEIIICSIHPIPRNLTPNSATPDSSSLTYISIDIALGLPMFARLYLICRFLVFHSNIIRNASSQSLGYLNQISIDVFFLMKTYLEQWPTRCLIIFCTITFFVGSWSLRACNYRPPDDHVSLLDSMWLFIVTFTTVGYGELTPSTYCGRSVAAIISLMGIFSISLLVSILAQKLVLTRWEKCVHEFVLNIDLSKQRKHQAANIIKFAIKVWYLKRRSKSKSLQCIKSQWKLFQSIRLIQDIKLEQRKFNDSCVGLQDLYYLQRGDNQQMNMMKVTMDNIQNTLNILMNRLQRTEFLC